MAKFGRRKPGASQRFFKPEKLKTDKLKHRCEVSRLASDGRGIAHIDGKVVFVAGALPGELVIIETTSDRKQFFEAKLLTIERSSPHRITPRCEHYQICGGCNLQHFSYEQQLQHKADQLQYDFNKITQRYQQPPIEWLKPLSAAAYYYRHRIRLVMQIKKRQLGFRQGKSHRLVAISHCEIVNEAINRLLASLKELLKLFPEPDNFLECEIIIAKEQRSALHFLVKKPLQDCNWQQLQVVFSKQPAFDHTQLSVALQQQPWQLLQMVNQQHLIYPEQDNDALVFSSGDFTQVNPAINQLMIQRLLELLEPAEEDTIADLFSGIGNLTLPIALLAKKVLAYEVAQTMLDKARDNASRHKLFNIEFKQADLFRDEINFKGINKVVLDPPRAGAEAICRHLAEIRSNQPMDTIVYISCNPQTQLRDITLLLNAGYRIKTAGLIDMFPQTAHKESIVFMQ